MSGGLSAAKQKWKDDQLLEGGNLATKYKKGSRYVSKPRVDKGRLVANTL